MRSGQISANSTITISEFRPDAPAPYAKIVYLSPERERAIMDFLESRSAPKGVDGTAAPASSLDRNARRYFLVPFIYIIPGHRGGWHVVTHPEVLAMILDEPLSAALVQFRNG